MNKQARVTISSRHGAGRECILLAVTDGSSGLRIVEVEMDLSDFAACVTGLAASPACLKFSPSQYGAERFGKKKVVERVTCERAIPGEKDVQRQAVSTHFAANYLPTGWELWDDGTTSQQRGDHHAYVICKYVEE